MQTLNSRALKDQAREHLSHSACDYKKLTLIHTVIAVGVSLVVVLLQYFLRLQIDNFSGLSGLGTRTILETIQAVLAYAVNLALPFWEIGFVAVALRLARGKQADLRDLPEGFRRFGSVLWLFLMQGLLYMGAGFLCLYAGAFLFAFTPLSASLQEMLTPIMATGADADAILEAVYALPQEELFAMMLPAAILIGLLFLVVGGCLFYRFRVAQFVVMDEPRAGALMAMILSTHMTKRKRWKLLRLDLNFWWFYALAGVAALVSYGDVLLPLVVPELPVNGEVLQILCLVLSGLIQILIYWQFYCHVQTTWAVTYDVLRQQLPQMPMPRQQQNNWNDNEQDME